MHNNRLSRITLTGIFAASILSLPWAAQADMEQARLLQDQTEVLESYRRLLPLEGGSNFRDMGGYKTTDNKTVKRGLLFRSGVMTWLTEADQEFLEQLGMESIVDLRSSEELELFPNHWARQAGIDYYNQDYSIETLLAGASTDISSPASTYASITTMLKPQLRQYFDLLIDGKAPLVVNCSAGQDRTGITSALLLSTLGVPHDTIIEDYLLSTDFRRPEVERGKVDLKVAAETNAFAKVMLRYGEPNNTWAKPLITEDGTPYLMFAFAQIEKEYGSVRNFLEQELDVTDADIARLKEQYLQ